MRQRKGNHMEVAEGMTDEGMRQRKRKQREFMKCR
jgi:hypothetical protein